MEAGLENEKSRLDSAFRLEPAPALASSLVCGQAARIATQRQSWIVAEVLVC